jgi:PPOX class probable F420-dependent enzyme
MLDQKIKDLISGGKNFACISTVDGKNIPHSTIVWIGYEGDFLVYNTEVHRKQFKNIKNNPNISVAIWDSANPYRYAEVVGNVSKTETGEVARKHIDELSNHYTGANYGMEIASERVKVYVNVVRQRIQG